MNDAYSKKELASGMHRCEMLRLALQDSDWIRLSTWELRQPGWTRTRKCLQHHQQLLATVVLGQSADSNRNNEGDDNEDLEWIPEGVRNNEAADQTAVQIKLLCGGDLLESFATVGLWADEDVSVHKLLLFVSFCFFWVFERRECIDWEQLFCPDATAVVRGSTKNWGACSRLVRWFAFGG